MPEGFTQVIAVDCGMPSCSANPKLVSTACCLNLFRSSAFPNLGLSNMPVSETPRRLSSSVLFCQTFRRYLNSVSVDCIVPSIVASSTFLANLSISSSALTTTSVKLQN